MNRFYVTTPIYYVNDKPHIGHAYTTILADVMARFHRLLGEESYFLTGVDEHGQKVQEAAAKRGMDPQVHCDEMHLHFKNLWPTLSIEPDDFIRTTEDRHKRVVREALSKLYAQGDIYEKEYEGWYSASVERYWTEKDLVDGKCPESGAEVTYLKEKNYFFRMSHYKDQLLNHIQDCPGFIQPENRRNEVLGFLQNELRDLCISRPKHRLAWGIELPFDPDFVTYVWFDALLNYASAIGLFEDAEKFEKWWPASTHLLGKDILTTHCVYWPTFLLALGLPLPKTLIAHGWWLMSGTKMSKSLGNVVDPFALRNEYGPDVLRYFLIRDMSLGQDATFTLETFIARNNGDLANDLGNLVSRVTKLMQKEGLDGTVPAPGTPTEEDAELVLRLSEIAEVVQQRVGEGQFNLLIDDVLERVRMMNRYIAETVPFKVVKTNPERARQIMYNLLEGLRIVGSALSPVIPEKGPEIVRLVGGSPGRSLEALAWGGLAGGERVSPAEALFKRAEFPKESPEESTAVDAPLTAVTDQEGSQKKEGKPMIEYDDFAKIEMVVGKVLEAEKVEKAAKLLRVQVDIGTETRQVVAGIAKYYSPEDLVGKNIVLLKNLKPRKLFGLESQGMILAAEGADGQLTVVTPAGDVQPGSEVA